jgi:protein SCO1/2
MNMSSTQQQPVPNTTPSWSPATTAKVVLGGALGAAALLVGATMAFSPGRSPREMKNAFRDARRLSTVIRTEAPIPAGVVAEIQVGESGYRERPAGAFKLVDQTGAAFGSDDLKGKWWVAGFVFTGCATTCPPMAGAMQHIQASLNDQDEDVRLVFFSVDSDNDTPERLAEFGERYGADPDRWKMLTGEGMRESIWDLATNNFFAGVLKNDGEGAEPIMHSRKFFLVNPDGMIVHHCDGLEASEVEDLIQRVANR